MCDGVHEEVDDSGVQFPLFPSLIISSSPSIIRSIALSRWEDAGEEVNSGRQGNKGDCNVAGLV